MILRDEVIIQSDVKDIIDTLRIELAERGINRFATYRDGNTNVQVTCPFHKDGQEKKPSFGININNGKCHCFTCNWSGDLATMISQLQGYDDGGKKGLNWLQRKYSSVEIENRPDIFTDIRSLKKEAHNIITEEQLDKYRYIHPYMYERGLTDDIIERFDIGYDKVNKCITFPIKDLNGDVIFIATRSVNGKFFTLPQGRKKPVYCADIIKKGLYSEVYVTESFLNCLTCWKYGKPAVALIGTGNKYQADILNSLPVRSYILALDPDKAGQKGCERMKKYLKNKIVKTLEYTNDTQDINDLQQDFLDLKKVF